MGGFGDRYAIDKKLLLGGLSKRRFRARYNYRIGTEREVEERDIDLYVKLFLFCTLDFESAQDRLFYFQAH